MSKMFGMYHGIVKYTRLFKGSMFIRAKILALSTKNPDGTEEQEWISRWAPVSFPMSGALEEGDGRYGDYSSIMVDDNVLIAFENGDQTAPYCMGSVARFEHLPPEFCNDDYTQKEYESDDRQSPDVNMAKMLQTLGLYILLHQKTNHLVLDVATVDGAPEPRLEIGENATELGWEIALGRRFVEQFLKHRHDETGKVTGVPRDIDYEEADDYLSEFAFINKTPRNSGQTTEEQSSAATVPDDSETETTDETFLEKIVRIIDEGGDIEDIVIEGIIGDTVPSKEKVAEVVEKVKDFGANICKVVTAADEFMDDPVGMVVDGIADGLTAAAADLLPDFDGEECVNQAAEFLADLGGAVVDGAKKVMSDFVGEGGELGSKIGGDASAALQGQVDGMDLSAVSNFVNDGASKLLEMADEAGVTDAIAAVSTDLIDAAIDTAVDAVKEVANDVIGEAVASAIPDIPFLDSALDLAAGICAGNIADTISSIFGLGVDALNTVTGGLLTPFTGMIKSIGSGLISGLFNKGDD